MKPQAPSVGVVAQDDIPLLLEKDADAAIPW
jgi:hypothetical protein